MEIGAAVFGTIYLIRKKNPAKGSGLIVFYLWMVVFVEIVGLYPAYAYFNDYTKLGFIKNTLYERNYWWFNIYHIFKILILSYYFIIQFRSKSTQNIFKILSWIIIISFIGDYIFLGNFFSQFSLYSSVVGSLYLIILIMIYYFELLKSSRILTFYKNSVFYISVGMVIWHAVVTPIFIYNKYFSMTSPEFVKLHITVLQYSNIFLYGIIILGFLVCLQKGNYGEIAEN